MIVGLYFFIGLVYWAVNIFIRKLHKKNEPGEGWLLAPLWLLGWPLCFLSLFTAAILDYTTDKL